MFGSVEKTNWERLRTVSAAPRKRVGGSQRSSGGRLGAPWSAQQTSGSFSEDLRETMKKKRDFELNFYESYMYFWIPKIHVSVEKIKVFVVPEAFSSF